MLEGTRTCKHCGRVLPTEAFLRNGIGVTSVCLECANKKRTATRQKTSADSSELAELKAKLEEKARTELQAFTPRELMLELKRRGYTGTLEYVETRIVNLDTL